MINVNIHLSKLFLKIARCSSVSDMLSLTAQHVFLFSLLDYEQIKCTEQKRKKRFFCVNLVLKYTVQRHFLLARPQHFLVHN